MIALIRRVRAINHFYNEAFALIEDQHNILRYQQSEMERQRLEYIREMHGLVSAWILSIEQPELDLRPDLVELDRMLGNQIAKIEEHVL